MLCWFSLQGEESTYIILWYCSVEWSVMRSAAYILIGHLPVRPLTIWHHFPHDSAKTPDVTSWGKFSIRNSLWCCPAYWYLSSLENMNQSTVRRIFRIFNWYTCQIVICPGGIFTPTLTVAVYVASVSSSRILDMPKSDTLHTRFASTKILRAARSLWT